MSELMGEDFKQVLPQVLPFIIQACADTRGVTSENEVAEALGLGMLYIYASKLTDENDGEPAENYTVTMSFVDSKVSALETLALFAYNCKEHILPFLKPCLEIVYHYLSYVHPGIRKVNSARFSLNRFKAARKPAEALLTVVSQAYPSPGGKWRAGVPADQQPLSNETRSIAGKPSTESSLILRQTP